MPTDDIDRTTSLGSSDIGAVAGVNPHRSKLDVWAEKLQLAPPFEGNEATRIGQAIEAVVLDDLYAKARGVHHVDRPGVLWHPRESWIRATPDGVSWQRQEAQCVEDRA